ncbi:hypothetical protein [Lactobacillus sp.]|uniref:hypothetical protein n=1 Tax=Lactobacillus sp. TaxID=1591 RepID=UPI003EF8512F
MAQQYYSMDQIAKLAKVSQQQVYYLINMKFKFKPTLVDPKGNKFYDERAVGQIFQDLGKVLPKSVASPATDNGLLDINAIAETTGIGKKKLRIFIREHKEIKPDFIDEKNHNKKYWGPSAIQYIHDHFEAEEAAKAEPEAAVKEEKPPVAEAKVEEAPKAEVKEEKTEETPVEEPKEAKTETVPVEKDEEKVEKTEEVKEEQLEAAEEPEEKKVTGPVFVKKAPRPDDKLKEHPAVELPFSFDDQEEAKPEVDEKAEAKPTAKAEEKTEAVETPSEVKEEKAETEAEVETKAEAKPEKAAKESSEEDNRGFVVRKRDDDRRSNRRPGRNNRQNGYQKNGYQNNRQGYQKNNYQNNRQQNYAKRRELFEGKFKLVTEKGTFYTDQFKSLDELAEYVLSSKGEFMKVEKYNRGEFAPAYISTKSIIEFEEA